MRSLLDAASVATIVLQLLAVTSTLLLLLLITNSIQKRSSSRCSRTDVHAFAHFGNVAGIKSDATSCRRHVRDMALLNIKADDDDNNECNEKTTTRQR